MGHLMVLYIERTISAAMFHILYCCRKYDLSTVHSVFAQGYHIRLILTPSTLISFLGEKKNQMEVGEMREQTVCTFS